MDPDIEWITMWHYKVKGCGPGAVAEGLFKPLMAEWTSFSLVPIEFITEDENVVSLGDFKGVHGASGKTSEARYAHVWTVKDGKIARFRQYIDPLAIAEARRPWSAAVRPTPPMSSPRPSSACLPENHAMSCPPLPRWTEETAIQKVRAAEDAWNSRDPAQVVLAYTPDCRWRNRVEFPNGREEIQAFLTHKWGQEVDYRLIKELWTVAGDRIAVRFAYEYCDYSGQWSRAYGNENWRFDADGLMAARFASINEHLLAEAERRFRWPLGRRPDDHPGLSDLGL